MGLFSAKKNILGVDLGSTSIKIVELKKKGSIPSLVTYGYFEQAEGDINRGDEADLQEKTAKSLKQLCERAGVTTKLAVTALPNFSVFSSTLTLPVISQKELKIAVVEESKKIIPVPFENIILDWKILEKIKISNGDGRAKENYKILINVASKNLVKKYSEIFKQAGLQLVSLETEAFALARALVGRSQITTMIIDFSAVSTDIIIVEKTMPVFSRSIDMGGVAITRSVAQGLDLDFTRAEQFKRDMNAIGENKIPAVVENTLKSIVEEIKYSLEVYKKESGKNVEEIVLSGGSAYLPRVDEYFSQGLNMKVIVGNPWKKINYQTELEPALIEVAPRFSVAIGLALR